MSSNLSYLIHELPQFQDEIRLLNLHNHGFKNMAIEYQQLINRIQALDDTTEAHKRRQYQHRQDALKQSIQSMLVKHALAATL